RRRRPRRALAVERAPRTQPRSGRRGHAGPVGAAFGACAGAMPARRRTALGAQVHQLEYPPPRNPGRGLSRNAVGLGPARPGARPGLAPGHAAGLAWAWGYATSVRGAF